MDPITHGLAGALLGKAFFAGGARSEKTVAADSSRHGEAGAAKQARRMAVGAVTLGALFPDADIVFNLFTNDNVALLELHRGFTHSFVCLPLFAMVLAWATRALAGWRGWAAPSWMQLTMMWGAGIGLHILMDLITSYGTMIWSPISNYRAALDMNFILDFVMTGIALAPQLAAWTHRRREGRMARALVSWTIISLGALGVEWLARTSGYPFTPWAVVAASGVAAAMLFLPMRADQNSRWRGPAARARWCRAGVAVFAAYLLMCAGAQLTARWRVEAAASAQGLRVERLAAVPLPPSLLAWGALVRTPDGVYRGLFDLRGKGPIELEFIADSPANEHIERARALRSTQVYLWFARFPGVRYHQENGRHVVEFTDYRFAPRSGSQRTAFTFRVVLDSSGAVVEEGWAN